jgi:hypothetical protein
MDHKNSTLTDNVGFDLLGEQLGPDLKLVLKNALAAGVVFDSGKDPLTIFRHTIQSSIRNIEDDERGLLFQRLLRDGPYEGRGPIPKRLQGKVLTDDETRKTIRFIYSFMVNSFKGAVTELLASQACLQLIKALKNTGALPLSAKLYVGDAVMICRKHSRGYLKGADLHILIADTKKPEDQCFTVAGVAEVKSGRKSAKAMSTQLERHIRRAKQGLFILNAIYSEEQVKLGYGINSRILKITVQPSDWKIPRTIQFKKNGTRDLLTIDAPSPPFDQDQITQLENDHWHISLRWSKEAIASTAYEMTFWYMEKVGEVIFQKNIPREWSEMTPAEAGRNAVKMMLYYSLLRILAGSRDDTRATALYNTYCFGYALGMNFRNKNGHREMLWPEDLKEIALNGHNRNGCRIV